MKRQYIIPVFLPQAGCGQACVYCNQRIVSGQQKMLRPHEIKQAICEQLAWYPQEAAVQIAFYGGSFTALPLELQAAYLEAAQQALPPDRLEGIRLSTRPDCIDETGLKLLKQYGVKMVELGVQSLNDQVLVLSGRSHRAEDVYQAVALLKAAGIDVGIQLMPGLPGENWPSLLATVRQVVALKPLQVRIYPTLVLAGTQLAQWYEQGFYLPLTLEKAIQITAWIKEEMARHNIQVIRMGLQASSDVAEACIAGPYHPAFGELVVSQIWLNRLLQALAEIQPQGGKVVISCPYRQESQLRGQKNKNMVKLQQYYPQVQFSWRILRKATAKVSIHYEALHYQVD